MEEIASFLKAFTKEQHSIDIQVVKCDSEMKKGNAWTNKKEQINMVVTTAHNLAHAITKGPSIPWETVSFLVIDIDNPHAFVSELSNPYVKRHLLNSLRGGISNQPQHRTIVTTPPVASIRQTVVDEFVGSGPMGVFEDH